MLIRSEKGQRRLALSETWVRFGSQLSGECRAETEDDCERTYPISNIILVLPICAKQAFSHDLANNAYTGLFLCVPAVKSWIEPHSARSWTYPNAVVMIPIVRIIHNNRCRRPTCDLHGSSTISAGRDAGVLSALCFSRRITDPCCCIPTDCDSRFESSVARSLRSNWRSDRCAALDKAHDLRRDRCACNRLERASSSADVV
jgi:hypothetical protein